MFTNKDVYPKLEEIKRFDRKQLIMVIEEWIKVLYIISTKISELPENTNIVAYVDYDEQWYKLHNVSTNETNIVERSVITDTLNSL